MSQEPKPATVDELVNNLTATEKQNAQTVFEAPRPPAFMLDDEPEPSLSDDDDDIADELIEEDDPSAEGFVSARKGKGINAEFYAGGFVDFYAFGMARSLAWLNDADPEEYDIDEFEERELTESVADMMQSSGRKFTPGQRLLLASIIIWGRGFVAGVIKKGKALVAWWRNRKAKATKAETIATDKPKEENTISLTAEEIEAIYADARAKAAQDPRPQTATPAAQPAKAQKRTEGRPDKPTAKKEPMHLADTTDMTPPPLDELQRKHAAGLCLFPNCHEKTSGKFCGNAHKLAYGKAVQTKGSNWISAKEVTR